MIHLAVHCASGWLMIATSRRITCAKTPAASGVFACRGDALAETKTDQGYGWTHQQERARWVKYQQAGGDDPLGDHHGELKCRADACVMPSRWIGRREVWDLGHHPGQQTWRGPEHVKCNRSAGARNSNRGGNPGRGAAGRRRRSELIEVSVDVSDL